MTKDERAIQAGSSPDFVRTSTAAAMTLKYYPGKFHRGARLKALNLLLTYDSGCYARCAYCGLSSSRSPERDSFIRVDWPAISTEEVIERANRHGKGLDRVCISMITHPNALKDLNEVARRFRDQTELSISALIGPTMIRGKKPLQEMKRAGVDRVGIAVDAATRELFEKFRGRGVRGPHKWDHYWNVLDDAVTVFGRGMVGVHLIVGLGETEVEMVEAIQTAHDRGACTHLFSFYPEEGSAMERWKRPDIGSYHRVQLARHIIDNGLGRADGMNFDRKGRITGFGVGKNALDAIIDEGEAFMTSGCPGKDGKVACNRPYGNERPSEKLRNYPFLPNGNDIKDVRMSLKDYR
jgi:biotin synthase-related radical SAM superfamily protein